MARGSRSPGDLAEVLHRQLMSEEVDQVLSGIELLWMATAYRRRAAFEREHFAEVPEYQVAHCFEVTWPGPDVIRRHLEHLLAPALHPGGPMEASVIDAITAFDHASAELGAGPGTLGQALRVRPTASRYPAWFPGSRYHEAPMVADGVRTFADERELVRGLEARIRGTVDRVSMATGCPRAHGNHAKATVLEAYLEADPAARPEWRALLGPGRMHGGLRLSNSSPDLRTPDHKGNLFGFRFSFLLDPAREAFETSQADGGWMTFTANSAARAHVATPERHIAFTASIGSPHPSKRSLLHEALEGAHGPVQSARHLARLAREVLAAVPQGREVAAAPRLVDLSFHSRHGYRLGAQAVRYVVHLVDPDYPEAPATWGNDPDFRHRVLRDVITSRPLMATIGLQVLPDDAPPLAMIEDMRADWTGVPVQPFARVQIPRQQVVAGAARDRMVRWFSDNPVDLRAAGGWLAPLGAAGRARTPVYAASQQARAGAPPLGLPPRLGAS